MQKFPFLVAALSVATTFEASAQRAALPAVAAPIAAAAQAPMQRTDAATAAPRPVPPPVTESPQQQSPPAACAEQMLKEKELTPEDKAARAFRVPLAKGAKLAKAVGKVTKELVWQSSLADAQKLASREGKPIVWIQALGTLKGFL